MTERRRKCHVRYLDVSFDANRCEIHNLPREDNQNSLQFASSVAAGSCNQVSIYAKAIFLE